MILHSISEALLALTPLTLFAAVLFLTLLRVSRAFTFRVARGLFFAFLGLWLFLMGVRVGFLPAGTAVGESMAELSSPPAAILAGLALGFVATFAEPAVRILGAKVEETSSGYLPERVILVTISSGVALAVALSVARIIYGIPLVYLVVPGYVVVLLSLPFVDRRFISLAFDAGGVATGAMTVTFVVAVAIGIAEKTEGRDPVMDGLGLIALVALAPIMSVTVLGVLFRRKEGGAVEDEPS